MALGAVWLTGVAAVLPNGTELTWYTAFVTPFNSVYEPSYVWFTEVITASLLANPMPLSTVKSTDATIRDTKLVLTDRQTGPRSASLGTMTSSPSRQPCPSTGPAVGTSVGAGVGFGVGDGVGIGAGIAQMSVVSSLFVVVGGGVRDMRLLMDGRNAAEAAEKIGDGLGGGAGSAQSSLVGVGV